MNRKKLLFLRVNVISNKGKVLSFGLKREVNKELSESEIKYKYIGQTFDYGKTTYKITEIIKSYFSPGQYFVSPKEKYEEQSKGFISVGDQYSFEYPALTNSTHEFKLSESEGVFFNEITYPVHPYPFITLNIHDPKCYYEFVFSWDSDNYYFISDDRDLGGPPYESWKFPKKDWEVHFKPKDNTEYFDAHSFFESYLFPQLLYKDDKL